MVSLYKKEKKIRMIEKLKKWWKDQKDIAKYHLEAKWNQGAVQGEALKKQHKEKIKRWSKR